MKINDLKEECILFNPKTKTYIQIKEITRDTVKYSVQYFVCSGNTNSFSDAQTTITRQVIYWTDLSDYFYLDPIGEDIE